MEYVIFTVGIILGYLIGSISPAIIISRAVYHEDIRTKGSGNAGTTNMLRSFGKIAALCTLIFDLAKGLLPVLGVKFICKALSFDSVSFLGSSVTLWAMALTGLGVIIGHNWPLYFKFKGGKGVLSSFAVIVAICPIPALMSLGLFIIVVAISKYVSLGSILGGISIPFFMFFFGNLCNYGCAGLGPVFYLCVILGAMIVIRHHANIKRIFTGTESKLNLSKK